MIKLIVGTKGSGKTKAMIDQINDAVKTSKGNVVVVEKGVCFPDIRLFPFRQNEDDARIHSSNRFV